MLTEAIGIAIVEDTYTFLYSFNFKPTPQGRFQLLRKLHLVFSLEEETAAHDSLRCQLLCAWTPFFTENKYTDKAFYIKFPALEDLILDFSDWELQDGEGIMVSRVSITRGRLRRANSLLTSRTPKAIEILRLSFTPQILLYSLTCPGHASHSPIQPLPKAQEAQSGRVALPKFAQAIERWAPRRRRYIYCGVIGSERSRRKHHRYCRLLISKR